VLERAAGNERISNLPLLRDQPNRANWLHDHLQAFCPRDEQLILVRLPGEDPKQAAAIVNAVAQSYLEVTAEMRQEEMDRRSQFLGNEIERQWRELQRLQATLVTLTKSTHSDPLTRQLAAERYAGLCGTAAKIREQRLELELQIAAANVQLQQTDA